MKQFQGLSPLTNQISVCFLWNFLHLGLYLLSQPQVKWSNIGLPVLVRLSIPNTNVFCSILSTIYHHLVVQVSQKCRVRAMGVATACCELRRASQLNAKGGLDMKWYAIAIWLPCYNTSIGLSVFIEDCLYVSGIIMNAVKVTVKLSAVSVLVLLWLWSDRCQSLTDSSLSQIFFPFGTDEGDNIVTVGGYCDGPINIPYRIFNHL